MRMFKPLAAMASLSLAAAPALAQTSAASLSVAQVSAPAAESSDFRGSYILPGIILAAMVIGAIVLIADHENDRPSSP